MNAFYDYLAELEPCSAAKKRDIRRCTKRVLGSMKPQPKLRRRFRIALVCSVVLLTVCTVIPVMQSFADRPDWRDTYEFQSFKPESEIDRNLDMLREILVTDSQTVEQDGYTLTLSSYATDGVTGAAFAELKVPDDFDWQYPYFGGYCEAVWTDTETGEVILHGSKNGAITCQGALTPTADPNIYRAQWMLRPVGDSRTEPGGMPQHLDAPVPYTLTISKLELRDEYYDFDDKTREYTNHRNPHRIVFDTDFQIKAEQNHCMREWTDERFGKIRVTPFGLYLWSYDDLDIARNYEAVSPVRLLLTMRDGSGFSQDTARWNTGNLNANNYTDEALAIMQERSEELPPPCANFCMYFWDAVNPADAVQIGFENGDAVIPLG